MKKSSSLLAAACLLLACAAFSSVYAHPWEPQDIIAKPNELPRSSQDASGKFPYTNRLIREKSPYLLLHAHNPVDWYPWGDEAFEKARREQKPIFLSIGYYTCHWCHVMERESYSNPEIAAVLNKDFIAIKVDREERPDVDRLYIAYVEAATGSAGWPLNVFLTPDRKPFYGGTYFPPGQLKMLLMKIAGAWAQDRENISRTATLAAQELVKNVSEPMKAAGPLRPASLEKAFQQISSTYDPANGGFGPAPKFPRPVVLDFLFRTYVRTGQRGALDMTLATLRSMARGGIHDQLGGGFHRYSTDAQWRVPHFEKMLYDQAQLAVSYTEAYQVTHDPFFAGIARDILDFSLCELQQPGGGFASALDADSQLVAGEPETGEGAFYAWTAHEIESALGKQNAAIFEYAYGVDSAGNVSNQQDVRGELAGKNVLYEKHSVEEVAKQFGLTAGRAREQLAAARKALLNTRSRRPRPPLDDKIVTAWNGMMISALARASQALPLTSHSASSRIENDLRQDTASSVPKSAGHSGASATEASRYLAAAESTTRFLESHLYDPKSGRLWRSYRAGSATVNGFLDDYTDLIAGLLDLYQAGFDVHWLKWAVALQEEQDRLFWDAKQGGYFDTTASDTALLARTREAYDGAEPSPNSTAAMNLLRLVQITDRADWREKAKKTLASLSARLESSPEDVPALASALDYNLAHTKQILIAGDPAAPDTRALLRMVNARFLPNAILLLAEGGAGQEQLARWLPFVAGAHRIRGKATAYICENYICKLPTSDPAVVARLLDSKP